MAELSYPMGLPYAQAGFLNVGGDPIPVYHLSRLLSLPDCEMGLYSHILLSRGPRPQGFLCQGVSRILDGQDSAI